MTLFVGNLSTIAENSLLDQARTLTSNVQLLLMNQARIHELPAASTVNGFVDTFTDQSGIDLELTTAFYDDLGHCYAANDASGSLTQTSQINMDCIPETLDSNELILTDEGLSIRKTIVIDGSSNNRTEYATTAMTSNFSPAPLMAAASSEHTAPDCYAWKAFDHDEAHSTDPQECWIAAAAASESIPQWLKIDLGPEASIAINKYRFLSRNSSDPCYVASPRDFELAGSNNDLSWVSLDSRTDFDQLPSNTWSEYLTFTNGAGYRYYRLSITRSWGDGLTSLSQLKLVDAEYSVPDSIQTAILPAVVTSGWSGIRSVIPVELTPGSTLVTYALSFNSGSDSESWCMWNGSSWKCVAELRYGSWRFLDETGTWVEAGTNTAIAALNDALSVNANQMESQVLASIDVGWSEIFVAGEMSIAVGMMAGENLDVRVLAGFNTNYDISGTDLDLVSQSLEGGSSMTRFDASLLLNSMNFNLKLWISFGDGSPEWIEFPQLTKTASLSPQMGCYSASVNDLGEISGPLKIRLTAPAGFGTEIYGWAFNWWS